MLSIYLKGKHLTSADLNCPVLNPSHFTAVLNGHSGAVRSLSAATLWVEVEETIICGANWKKLEVQGGTGELGG